MQEKEILDSEMNQSTVEETVDGQAQAQTPDTDGPEITEPSDAGDVAEDYKAQVRELNEKVLRQAAEFQNYRRRMEKANVEAIALGKSIVVQRLLDVVDDLERSLDAAEVDTEAATSQDALRDGVKLVYQKFLDELGRLGVEPIQAIGVHFNEDEHEAMMQQPAPEGVEPGVVIQEIQKGYRMADRILRHSKVIVAA